MLHALDDQKGQLCTEVIRPINGDQMRRQLLLLLRPLAAQEEGIDLWPVVCLRRLLGICLRVERGNTPARHQEDGISGNLDDKSRARCERLARRLVLEIDGCLLDPAHLVRNSLQLGTCDLLGLLRRAV